MSFDRIGNLGKSSTMKARLQEEVRLVEIALLSTRWVHTLGHLESINLAASVATRSV